MYISGLHCRSTARVSKFTAASRGPPCDSTAFLVTFAISRTPELSRRIPSQCFPHTLFTSSPNIIDCSFPKSAIFVKFRANLVFSYGIFFFSIILFRDGPRQTVTFLAEVINKSKNDPKKKGYQNNKHTNKIDKATGLPSVILPSPVVGIQNVSGIKKDRRTLGMIRT